MKINMRVLVAAVCLAFVYAQDPTTEAATEIESEVVTTEEPAPAPRPRISREERQQRQEDAADRNQGKRDRRGQAAEDRRARKEAQRLAKVTRECQRLMFESPMCILDGEDFRARVEEDAEFEEPDCSAGDWVDPSTAAPEDETTAAPEDETTAAPEDETTAAPATEAPATEAPATEAPATEAPATEVAGRRRLPADRSREPRARPSKEPRVREEREGPDRHDGPNRGNRNGRAPKPAKPDRAFRLACAEVASGCRPTPQGTCVYNFQAHRNAARKGPRPSSAPVPAPEEADVVETL